MNFIKKFKFKEDTKKQLSEIQERELRKNKCSSDTQVNTNKADSHDEDRT